jgi:hypothetical protein
MAIAVAAPISHSKAKIQLTDSRAGLMALCKNIKEPRSACSCFLVILDLEK